MAKNQNNREDMRPEDQQSGQRFPQRQQGSQSGEMGEQGSRQTQGQGHGQGGMEQGRGRQGEGQGSRMGEGTRPGQGRQGGTGSGGVGIGGGFSEQQLEDDEGAAEQLEPAAINGASLFSPDEAPADRLALRSFRRRGPQMRP